MPLVDGHPTWDKGRGDNGGGGNHTGNGNPPGDDDLEKRVKALEKIIPEIREGFSRLEDRLDVFLAAQAEREKVTLALEHERQRRLDERDERLQERLGSAIALTDEWNQKFRLLSERAVTAAEKADKSAADAASVKNNYWAAIAVQLLAVAAILVAAYFANQASIISVAGSTLSAYQAGKQDAQPAAAPEPPPTK